MAVSAEDCFVFVHPLLREAAYQLQLPSSRARLHEFALEVLGGSMDGDSLAAHGLELAEHARQALPSAKKDKARELNLLRREAEYLRLALEYARKHYRLALHTQVLDRLAEHELTGEDERVSLVREWAEIHTREGRTAPVLKRLEKMLAASPRDEIRGKLLNALGTVHYATHRLEQAADYYNQALEVHRRIGDIREQATTLGNLANILRVRGSFAESEAMFLSAIDLHRRIGNERGEAVALGNLSNLYKVLTQYTKAESVLRAAIVIHRRMDNAVLLTVVMGNLAAVLTSQGRHDEARVAFYEALRLSELCGSAARTCMTLSQLMVLCGGEERFAEGQQHAERAIKLARDLDDTRLLALIYANAGACFLRGGKLGKARAAYSLALHLSLLVGDKGFAGGCASLLCRLHLCLGEIASANSWLSQAVQHFGKAISQQDYLEHVLAPASRIELELAARGETHALRRAQELIAEYEDAVRELDLGANAQLRRHRDSFFRLLRDIEMSGGAGVLAGDLVDQIPQEELAALSEYYRRENPAYLEIVRKRPVAFAALERAAQERQTPDWRNESLD